MSVVIKCYCGFNLLAIELCSKTSLIDAESITYLAKSFNVTCPKCKQEIKQAHDDFTDLVIGFGLGA
jgi:hypothetical protein